MDSEVDDDKEREVAVPRPLENDGDEEQKDEEDVPPNEMLVPKIGDLGNVEVVMTDSNRGAVGEVEMDLGVEVKFGERGAG